MRRKDTTHDRRYTYACAPQVTREIAMHIASAGCRAMPHKAKKYRKPAHRKCRAKLPCISRLQAAGIFHVQHVAEPCRISRKSTKCLCVASAASVSAELFMIAQTSEQRTLLTFCSAFAKCPKYGERLGAITQGEDLTNGTLRCAGAFCKFAARAQRAVVFVCLRRECGAQALFASLRRERSAQVFSHLRAYLPPFVNGVPGNTGSLK